MKTKTDSRIKVDNLVVSRGDRRIVNDLSFDLRQDEVLGLIGPNGAGKSTVLAMLAGIDTFDSGSILLDNTSLASIPANERARRIGWVEQLGSVHWPISVERVVMLGRTPHLPAWGKTTAADTQAVEAALVNTHCDSLRHRRISTLSGGERARVLLARALAAEPTVLLADEPVSALDPSHQLHSMQLLNDYACDGRSVVVVMHDLSLAMRFCDRLLLLHKGKLISLGESAKVLSDENLASVYGISVVRGGTNVPFVIPEFRVLN